MGHKRFTGKIANLTVFIFSCLKHFFGWHSFIVNVDVPGPARVCQPCLVHSVHTSWGWQGLGKGHHFVTVNMLASAWGHQYLHTKLTLTLQHTFSSILFYLQTRCYWFPFNWTSPFLDVNYCPMSFRCKVMLSISVIFPGTGICHVLCNFF